MRAKRLRGRTGFGAKRHGTPHIIHREHFFHEQNKFNYRKYTYSNLQQSNKIDFLNTNYLNLETESDLHFKTG
jgi:hypothetical protein